jgi:diaminohydroxyphosphoribosylaminopyrimidine deaminase/5-amino-6-(5-phosphoribosylamino)uracil reductase
MSTRSFSEEDRRFLKLALDLAKIAKGTTSPNPPVGAVIVKNHSVLSMGATRPAGQAHAEIVALDKAGAAAKGATLYVTLEPCCHFGRTGPCTTAITRAGINRIVCCIKDPNPLVKGKGLAQLRRSGIRVQTGLLRKEAQALLREYIKYITSGLPFVTLKLALTWDGYIADFCGNSRWITGKGMRTWVHSLRSQNDAVMVGQATAKKDDPSLTVRHVKGKNPVRVIMDHDLSLPRSLRIAKTAKRIKTIIVHSVKKIRTELWKGADYIYIKGRNKISITTVLRELGKRGITSLLVEGGSILASEFISSGRVDRYCFCFGPLIMGSGIPAVRSSRIRSLKKALPLKNIEVARVGNDILMTGYSEREG